MRTGTHKLANLNWNVAETQAGVSTGNARSPEHAMMAILMDIRQELRAISERLDCHETLSMPRLLREIRRNTTKRKRQPRKATA